MNKKTILNSAIVRGLGEGTFFMSMNHYQNEIKEKLGFNAYPGTLNLKINRKQADFLKTIIPIKINGFKLGNKTYGGVSCYKAKIKNIDGAIIVPDLTKHKKNVIEFIAPVHLKSELKIKEGDKVTIKLVSGEA